MFKTLAFFSLSISIALHAQQTSSQRAQWNKPMEPFKIIGNIYYVGPAGVSSFLITTPAGHILLDGGLPESAPLIEKCIAKLGFRMSDVKFLMNSHAHYDHCGGLAELKRLSSARLVASEPDSTTLNSGGQADAIGFPKFQAVQVDRVVKDGDAVTLGGITLTAHLTPGHTKGCTTWTTTVGEAGNTYNVVFYCSTSVVDKLVGNKAYPNIASDYVMTFAKLRRIPCDVFLAPHAGMFDLQEKLAKRHAGRANPFIAPDEMRAYVDDSEREFQTELKKQTAAAHP